MIDGFRRGFFGVSDVSPWLSLAVVGGELRRSSRAIACACCASATRCAELRPQRGSGSRVVEWRQAPAQCVAGAGASAGQAAVLGGLRPCAARCAGAASGAGDASASSDATALPAPPRRCSRRGGSRPRPRQRGRRRQAWPASSDAPAPSRAAALRRRRPACRARGSAPRCVCRSARVNPAAGASASARRSIPGEPGGARSAKQRSPACAAAPAAAARAVAAAVSKTRRRAAGAERASPRGPPLRRRAAGELAPGCPGLASSGVVRFECQASSAAWRSPGPCQRSCAPAPRPLGRARRVGTCASCGALRG